MQIENENALDNSALSEATEEVAEQAGSETVEAADESDESEEGDDAPKKSKKVQKRIDEITKARREAERERDYWRMQAEQRALAEQQQFSIGQKPTLEQFDYDQEAYLEALADYKLQAKLAEKEIQSRTQEFGQQEIQQVQQFKQREYEVANEFPDYHQKVYANDVPITDTMAKAIRSDENGARVAYFLATYKDIAYRVANLSPREQFLAIGDISEKISQAINSPESAAGRVSKAPSPVPNVSSRGGAVAKSPEKMSVDEWMKWRQKQLSKR